jgi:hypothetical protein
VSAWLLALAGAIGLAALSYAPGLSGRDGTAGRPAWGPAALRAAAALLLAAAALDAPLGRARAAGPVVVLDASASWTRAADGAALAAARDSARRAARASDGTLLLAGDSLRADDAARAGSDAATRLDEAVDRATAAGRPLVFVTDGEVDGAVALARAPQGSRVVVVRPRRGPDAAVVDAEAPRSAGGRDTLDVRLTVAADAAGAPAGDVAVTLGGRLLATAPRPALAPFAREELRVRAPLGGTAAGPAALRIVARTAGDGEPRNDTLALTLDVTDVPAAVFVSGAPDYDARLILAAARGALGLPVRAFLRVAPGQWRVEGTLAPVGEGEVRAAAARASLLIFHGDTAALGPPRALGTGALALVASPADADSGTEWYASGAPPSPVAGALADVPWDSLPPLDLAGAAPAGDWTGLVARADRRGAPRAVIAGSDAGRRTLVVAAGGFWRWQFRGGRAADAATALWGALADWLAAGRGDARRAVPEQAAVRAGEVVRWRRGGADSVVHVVLAADGPGARPDTVDLRFAGGARTAEAGPRPAGLYTARVPGGTALVAVNAGRELLPRRPALASGPVGGGARASTGGARLRDRGWPYAAAALLLCAEWVLRRRRGLR